MNMPTMGKRGTKGDLKVEGTLNGLTDLYAVINLGAGQNAGIGQSTRTEGSEPPSSKGSKAHRKSPIRKLVRPLCS
jgi:hypothetical protein